VLFHQQNNGLVWWWGWNLHVGLYRLATDDSVSLSVSSLKCCTGVSHRSHEYTGCHRLARSSWHGTSVPVWTTVLYRVADIQSRRRLRSSTADDLFVPSSRLVSVGDRSFAAAAPTLWNTLPRRPSHLHHLFLFFAINGRHYFLFQKSYPDIIL